MAYTDIELNSGSGGAKLAVDKIGADSYEIVKTAFGSEGIATPVDAVHPLPVTDASAESSLTTLAAKDFATQTTLALIKSKTDNIDVALSTRTKPSDQQHVIIDSGGGGAVTIVDGGDVTQGAISDVIVAAGAVGTLSAKLRRATQGLEDLKTLIALAAGANIIGKVGIDQTTPGTTNGVQVNAALPAGTNLLGIVQSKDIPDASATYALSNATSTAYEASRVIKASAGYLFMITGYNSRTSSQFIMISNTTTVPADAQTPVLIFTVPAQSNFSFDLGKFGRYFSTGICIFNSSTSPTKTVGASDCFYDANYI